jgi:hypothetical protein
MYGTAALVVGSMLLAGCGSSGKPFTLAASRACISKLGTVTAGKDLNDPTAASVSGGALAVDVKGDSVTVMFHRTVGDAKRTLASAKLVGEAFGGPVNDITERIGTVVLVWANTPTQAQSSSVKDCLA